VEQSFRQGLRQAYSRSDEFKESAAELAGYLQQKYDISEIHNMYIDFTTKHLDTATLDTNNDQSTFYL
jgi:hypothetical protein